VPVEGSGDLQTLICPCGENQTMSHIVESCPLTKLNGGLSRLHSADEDAVCWLRRRTAKLTMMYFSLALRRLEAKFYGLGLQGLGLSLGTESCIDNSRLDKCC